MPGHFPNGFHGSLAPPKQSRGNPLAHPWSCDWTCCVAWNSIPFRRGGLRRQHWSSTALHVRHGSVLLLAHSIFNFDHPATTTEVRLGRFPEREALA